MKVVIDTNVLLSGIFWKGLPGKILDLWSESYFNTILSEPIFNEYKRVAKILERKYSFDTADAILDIIAEKSTFVNPVNIEHPKCTDPDDDMFLAAAVAGGAKFIISGDKALLNVNRYKNGKVITAHDFVALF